MSGASVRRWLHQCARHGAGEKRRPPKTRIYYQLEFAVGNFADKVKASVNIRFVDASMDRFQKELFAVHGTGAVVGGKIAAPIHSK